MLTIEDYREFRNKGNDCYMAREETSYVKDGIKYSIKFDTAAVPVNDPSKIVRVSADQHGYDHYEMSTFDVIQTKFSVKSLDKDQHAPILDETDYSKILKTNLALDANDSVLYTKQGQELEITFEIPPHPLRKGTELTKSGPHSYSLMYEGTLQCLMEVHSSQDEDIIDKPTASSTTKIGSPEYFVEKYGSYPPQTHIRFKYDKFVLSTLCSDYTNSEADKPDNTPDKKQKCRLEIKDGLLYSASGSLFSTDASKKAFNDSGEWIFVIDKKGRIYSDTMYGDVAKISIGNNHSFFLKSKEGKPFYGFGKPIALGGHLTAKDGKIIKIDNASGHYKPNFDQLKLGLAYLFEENLLSDEVDISCSDGNQIQHMGIDDVKLIDASSILDQYETLA